MKISRLGIVFGIGLVILLCGIAMPVSADNNTTINNLTNATDYEPLDVEEPGIPLYINTDNYTSNYQYWLDYHRSLLPSEEEQKQTIRGILSDESQDNETKFTNVLTYIGLSDEYKTMVDESKRTIDDYTGVITWDLGVGNWWGRVFGAGVYEDDLPQDIAELNAIQDIYQERYNLFSQVEWEMMFSES